MNTNAHQLTDHVDRTAAIISVNPTPHVVIEYDGNRVKAIHGPFESADAAMAAGNRTIDAPWGTHPLTPPEPDNRLALCSSCGWSGAVTEAVPSDDFELEYGDLVPVGRCPECDMAVYEAKKFADLIVTPDQYLVLDTLETVVGFDAKPRREGNGELVFDWGDVTYQVAEEGTLESVALDGRRHMQASDMNDARLIRPYTGNPTRAGHLSNTETRGRSLRATRRWMLATIGLTAEESKKCN